MISRWMKYLILACLLTNYTGGADGDEPPEGFTKAWDEVASLFEKGLQHRRVVGGSLMFIHDGAVLGETYYGLADEETGRSVDANTIFHWGSVTKTLTGIAVMQLRDRGLISLDDPIVEYLPELRTVHNPYGDLRDITIRHIMSHSAGFRGSTWPWGGNEPWHPHEPKQWDQLVAMMPYTRILFEPGSKYSYSNPAIIFLGRLIEQLSGDDFEVYMDKNVLKPLKMYRTYYDLSPYHLLPDRSNSYFLRKGDKTANGLDFDTGITVSNGGLNAPLGDMVNYLSYLSDSGITYELLKRSSLEEMWQSQVPISDDGTLKTSMGLTFFVLEREGLRVIGHTGTQKGFHSFVYVDPAQLTSAIFVVNTYEIAEGAPTRLLSAGIRDALLGNVFTLFTNQ